MWMTVIDHILMADCEGFTLNCINNQETHHFSQIIEKCACFYSL